jgi:hypothetical protein
MKITVAFKNNGLSLTEKHKDLIGRMLDAYRTECRTTETETIYAIEANLKPQLHNFLGDKEFTVTWETAVVSLRGWLLAFSAVAFVLLTLSLGGRNELQRPLIRRSLPPENVLTYNSETGLPHPISPIEEIEYVR